MEFMPKTTYLREKQMKETKLETVVRTLLAIVIILLVANAVSASECNKQAEKKPTVIKKSKVVKKQAPSVVNVTTNVTCASQSPVVTYVEKRKSHIVTLFVRESITKLNNKVSGNTATTESETGSVIGLEYLHQFNSGLVLGGSLDLQGKPALNVGYGF